MLLCWVWGISVAVILFSRLPPVRRYYKAHPGGTESSSIDQHAVSEAVAQGIRLHDLRYPRG